MEVTQVSRFFTASEKSGLTRMSHHPPATTAKLRVSSGRAPSAVLTGLKARLRASPVRAPKIHRHFGALAAKSGETSGLSFSNICRCLAIVMMAAGLIHCFGGTAVRGVGSSCYNGGVWTGKLGSKSECGKGLRCSAEFDHMCVKPVGEGQACDGWPHPNPYKPKGYRYCTIWGTTPDSHGTTQLGRCWKGKCVKAQKKGQTCTDPSGPGPWCLTPGGCRNGRCIAD